MPLQQTSGNVTADAYGGGVAVVPAYIEDVFSTYLYTGTGTYQTITNGIDLSTKGGLVWIKSRSQTFNHSLTSTNDITKYLISNDIAAYATDVQRIYSIASTGFTLGNAITTNNTSDTFASWTFRKQPKFFDVVTYTGTGSNTTIAHSLGSVPGCIIVKKTNAVGQWCVYHRGLTSAAYGIFLNLTYAQTSDPALWNSTAPTSTVFSLGNSTGVNNSGDSYVAYLFAHNAGGFGLTGTDNVITCGNFTTDASGNASVNLGYEPQYWLFKPTIAARQWTVYDTMRGWSQTYIAGLVPNTAAAESGGAATLFYPTATGFDCVGGGLDASTQHIYIAIRRGPMKVPTLGTQVYNGVTRAGTGSAATVTGAGFPPDLVILESLLDPKGSFSDRLRGPTQLLNSYETAAEATDTNGVTSFTMDGMAVGVGNNANRSGFDYVYWFLRRYPSVFDEVCFTGNNTYGYKNHNLTVVPELIISKRRDASQDWLVWQPSSTYVGYLNLTDAFFDNGPSPATATQFTPVLDQSSATYVVYLFASAPGVSKVGSYTGNGTTQTINCGFTGGARFVLLKRTDAAGSWYTYDTARGMTVLTDPYLRLNVNSAEVATLGSVTTVSTGFALNSTILAAINVSSGNYLFLAIA
jgi:hypothetical protein